MEHRRNSISESHGATWHVSRLVTGIGRVRLLIVLVGAAIIGYGIYQNFQLQKSADESPLEVRMPITNSPLEPDRPDLIGEPRIDE